MKVSIIISIFNSVIALPIWLLIMGAQLPNVRSHYESANAVPAQEPSPTPQNGRKVEEIPGSPPPAGAFNMENKFQSDIVVGAELS